MPKPVKSASPAEVAAAVPNYEVKLFLDPAKTLDVEFRPTAEAAKALSLGKSNRKIAMQFLDARPAQLHQEGWNVRVRRLEDEADFELTYKRRYRLGAGGLEQALAAAAADGFHAKEDDYAAQLEWGFANQTLSFTRQKPLKAKGHAGVELPTVEETRAATLKEMPGKLDRWKETGWAKGLLEQGTLYGPVLGRRWAGDWRGPGLSFEVWLIRTVGLGVEPIVELSFKAQKQADAAGFQAKLAEFVRSRGWLLERDVLKTALILERY